MVYQEDSRKERHCRKEGGRGPWFQGQVLWKGNTHINTRTHTNAPLFHFSNRWNLEGLSVGGSHEAYFINQAQCFSPPLLGEETITGVDT